MAGGSSSGSRRLRRVSNRLSARFSTRIMDEDAIQPESRGIDGLVYGYVFEDEEDDPAAR